MILRDRFSHFDDNYRYHLILLLFLNFLSDEFDSWFIVQGSFGAISGCERYPDHPMALLCHLPSFFCAQISHSDFLDLHDDDDADDNNNDPSPLLSPLSSSPYLHCTAHTCNRSRYVVNTFPELSSAYRDLPQYGHKQWQSYFGRTFDVYTKLWKFQQQNRCVSGSFCRFLCVICLDD